MSRRARLVLFAVSAAAVAALLFRGAADLPPFGHYQGVYGNLLNRAAVPERHTTNVVSAIVFDYRGFDTLGEEFILFTSVVGVALLLRERREENLEVPDDRVRSDAVRVAGLLMVGPTFVLGLWLCAYGWITPGGGFQGGVVLAGALLLVFVAGGYRPYRRATPPHAIDAAEGCGAGAYVALGLAGLVFEGAYLQNFLGPGETGTLYSGGSIAMLNWATVVAVCAAMLLLFGEFLEEYVAPVARRRP
jgi:multicomponent Na+:H+ antiporter subunit B